MCGIVGEVFASASGKADANLVGQMCKAIWYRGPDDQGVISRGQASLGMVRLAVIDIVGGAQPMSSTDQSVHLVFNGEIYNFISLRESLIQSGYTFRTQSDTEVLLRSWECWGKDCLSRIEGMFAFALWDRRERTLFLVRDRIGIKPLYTPHPVHHLSLSVPS